MCCTDAEWPLSGCSSSMSSEINKQAVFVAFMKTSDRHATRYGLPVSDTDFGGFLSDTDYRPKNVACLTS